MLLEDILLAGAVGIVLLMVGLLIYRFLKVAPWRRRDPLAEAQERLRIAKLEAEAARVNREAEKVYERLYEETLKDDRGGGGARVVADEAVQAVDEQMKKGKRHGQG
ncbi:MAG TPA: hypothetical protein VNZ26_26010 [Vicinamibacterales bacterium]|nr:hypothetical protein [Vicinamibacterales bacterium]